MRGERICDIGTIPQALPSSYPSPSFLFRFLVLPCLLAGRSILSDGALDEAARCRLQWMCVRSPGLPGLPKRPWWPDTRAQEERNSHVRRKKYVRKKYPVHCPAAEVYVPALGGGCRGAVLPAESAGRPHQVAHPEPLGSARGAGQRV